MTVPNESEIRRMGKGWFILKYAEDHGIKIATKLDYGKPKAVKTREAAYERTKNMHDAMIKGIKANGISKSVKAGNPVLDYRTMEGILVKL